MSIWNELYVMFCGGIVDNPYRWYIVKNTLRNGDVEYDIEGCWWWGLKSCKTLDAANSAIEHQRRLWDEKQGKQVVKSEVVK